MDMTELTELVKQAADGAVSQKAVVEKLSVEQKALRDELLALQQRAAVQAMPAKLPDTIGARFLKGFDADAYAKNGKQRVQVGGLLEKAALTTTDVSGPPRDGGFAPVATPPARVRELFSVARGTGSSVRFVRLSTYTINAAIVAEAGAKPESAMTFTPITNDFKVIAHWLNCTKQLLGDLAGFRQLIDRLLVWGLNLKLENYLLNDATDGVLAHAGAAAAMGGTPTTIDKIRGALAEVEVAGWSPTAVVMHPNQWRDISLAKATTGEYLLADDAPQRGIGAQVWGLPVVTSPSMPADVILVGDFVSGGTIFDRWDTTIIVSDENQDNFVKNIVTVLCEARLALALGIPSAFKKFTVV